MTSNTFSQYDHNYTGEHQCSSSYSSNWKNAGDIRVDFIRVDSVPTQPEFITAVHHHTHRVRGPFTVVGELQPLCLGGLIQLLTLVILDLRKRRMKPEA